MGNRIELPSGGWVEFRDLSDIRGGDRKKIMKDPRVTTARRDSDDIGTGYAITETLVEFLIERYQLEYAPFASAVMIKMTTDDWDQLTIPDQDTVLEQLEPARAALFPNAPSPDDMTPGSPTPPAGD